MGNLRNKLTDEEWDLLRNDFKERNIPKKEINKTKEQLAEEAYNEIPKRKELPFYQRVLINGSFKKGFFNGYDSRQPEIDALTKIAEEMAKDLIEQSEFLDGCFESVAKFYNYKQALNPPKQTKP